MWKEMMMILLYYSVPMLVVLYKYIDSVIKSLYWLISLNFSYTWFHLKDLKISNWKPYTYVQPQNSAKELSPWQTPCCHENSELGGDKGAKPPTQQWHVIRLVKSFLFCAEKSKIMRQPPNENVTELTEVFFFQFVLWGCMSNIQTVAESPFREK